MKKMLLSVSSFTCAFPVNCEPVDDIFLIPTIQALNYLMHTYNVIKATNPIPAFDQGYRIDQLKAIRQ